MPHDHECRHCEEKFICGEDRDVCFARYVVCTDCFRTVEVKYFLLVFVLAGVAIGLTLFLVKSGVLANLR